MLMLKRWKFVLLIVVFVLSVPLQVLAAEEEHEEQKSTKSIRNRTTIVTTLGFS
jgi:hypothetical protein